MSSVLNIDRFIIPNDIIISLCKIYEHIGKNEIYDDTLNPDLDKIIEQTVERDTFFLALILGLEISDSRMRLIITKDSSFRTKEESILYYAKETLLSIQKKHENIRFQSNDILYMLNYVYKQYNPIKFSYIPLEKRSVLQSQDKRSKRVILDEITECVENHMNKQSYELITLFTHFFVDFYNLEPFDNENLCASYILLYLLIMKSHLYAFRYISFFEVLYNNLKDFQTELKNASYQWKEGYPQVVGFLRVICKIIDEGYEKTENVIKEYKFDQNLSKGDNIEVTIAKLPEIFTKEEIRLKHPYVSESTINRALMKLRDENRIKPLGKGRSAKWIKITRGYNN